MIADRGYNRVDDWMAMVDRGVGLVIRYNPHGLKPHAAEGKLLEPEPVLQAATATDLCLPVQVHNPHWRFLNGSLHARRLPPARAAEARRRARAAAKKAGRQIRARTLALAGWVLIWTTSPPTVLPTATIRGFYRLRRQVELAIKRLKSILNIDRLRAKKTALRPICTSTASCSMPGWSRNGFGGVAGATGSGSISPVAPLPGGW